MKNKHENLYDGITYLLRNCVKLWKIHFFSFRHSFITISKFTSPNLITKNVLRKIYEEIQIPFFPSLLFIPMWAFGSESSHFKSAHAIWLKSKMRRYEHSDTFFERSELTDFKNIFDYENRSRGRALERFEVSRRRLLLSAITWLKSQNKWHISIK